MKISQLLPTQDGFRHASRLLSMMEYVKNGGVFSLDNIRTHSGRTKAPLISIAKFEDGQLYIHDGHHRAASILISEHRDELHSDEYYVNNVTYSYYTDLGFDVGWVTPFDPRTHVRFPNFCPFKMKAMELYSQDAKLAEEYVRNNSNLYLVPRTERHNSILGIIPKEILEEQNIKDF